MESHIKVLGILHIIHSSLGVLGALVVILIFGGLAGIIGTSGGDNPDVRTAIPILGGIFGLIAIFLLIVSLPGVIGGIGLLKLAPWSRILMIVISALDLISVPFGTALGVYGLWVLTKPETQALLERRSY